jgi:putative sigma-54 modulation protein
MRIDIQARGFELTQGLREHAERRLQLALGWADKGMRSVSVRLSDVNGPRGGNDKRCQIKIPLVGGADVVIDDAQTDLYVAIDRAAERTGGALARRLGRRREHRGTRLSHDDASILEPVLGTSA